MTSVFMTVPSFGLGIYVKRVAKREPLGIGVHFGWWVYELYAGKGDRQ